MTDLSVLVSTLAPWVLQRVGSFDELVGAIESRLPDDTHIVILEAKAMRSRNEFYNELTEKLKLPDYLGHNLNALAECVADLEWLDGHPLVVIVRDAEVMLQDSRERFEGFVETMRSAGEGWSHTIAEGCAWDRPAVPFHVVLNYGEIDASKACALPHIEIDPAQ